MPRHDLFSTYFELHCTLKVFLKLHLLVQAAEGPGSNLRYNVSMFIMFSKIFTSLQGVDAWIGSHPPTKTLPFHGDMTLGRWSHVPAFTIGTVDLQILFNRCSVFFCNAVESETLNYRIEMHSTTFFRSALQPFDVFSVHHSVVAVHFIVLHFFRLL